MTQTSQEQQAFEARLKPAANGCLEWIGPRHPNGYGRFTFKQKQRLAHRASYALYKGALSPSDCVLHHCDNPSCVNPDHLFLGDRGDNARDMASKGRQWVQQNPAGRPVCPIELKPRGEKHGMSKLTEPDVLAIRRRASCGELNKHLATEFSCTVSLISQVIRGQIWQHVGGPIRSSKPKASHHD